MSSRLQATRRAALGVEQLEDRLALDARSFVTGLYTDVLGRAPDTQGLNFWVGRIQSGTSNLEVAQNFWRSPEHRGLQVDDYFQDLLGRAPDANGRAFWVNNLLGGTLNELGVQAGILGSIEYVAAHSTPAAYVTGVYLDVLGRGPSISEQLFWTDVLAAGGALTVAGGILTSAESFVRILDDYYADFLNRNADRSGQSFWLAAIQSNRETVGTVAEKFLGSAEYAQIN